MSKTSTRSMTQPGLEGETTARKVRITTFGELLWDEFPDGARLGGASANVAFHAAQLGAESRLISCVGRDHRGHAALRKLQEAGVLTEDVALMNSKKTGSVEVTFANNEAQFRIEEDAAWDFIDPSNIAVGHIFASDIFCFGTLAQRNPPVRERLRKILKECARDISNTSSAPECQFSRPLRLLDMNLRSPYIERETIFDSLSFSDVVKLNENEAYWLQNQGATSPVETWLLERFDLRAVALTLGAEGARLSTPTDQYFVAGIPISGGDPVGAGDAFVAALAVGFAKGSTDRSSLVQANEYAAWVASQRGAMPSR